MKFQHLKPFLTKQDEVITMKALLTILGEQYVECYENDIRYKLSEITQIWRHRKIQLQQLSRALAPLRYHAKEQNK